MAKLDREILGGAGMVVLAVLLIYWPVRNFDFASLGDPAALFENSLIRCGFSLHDLPKAFAVEKGRPWSPLALFAHAAAFHFFGGQAGPHHLLSMALHGFNACLLFLLLALATGDRPKSALAALLFAALPANVEAVAWIAQLRVLLAAFFFLTGMAFYLAGKTRSGNNLFLPAALCHLLAILCGPEAIIFPLMLLLLDYWPLGRMNSLSDFNSLAREKWPLFLFSSLGILLAAIPYAGPQGPLDVGEGIGNSLMHFFACLRMIFWPDDLTVLRPYFLHEGPALHKGAMALLLAATLLACLIAKKRPALLAGWLWFLANLAGIPYWLHSPLEFTLSDWHAYIPSMGLAWAAAWMLPPLNGKMTGKEKFLALTLVLALALNGAAARRQVGAWKNDRELFRKNLHLYPTNPVALTGLGNWLTKNGYRDLAKHRYNQALAADPAWAPAHYHLANALAAEGRLAEAEAHYRLAVQYRPLYAQALNQLGNLLARTHRPREGLRFLEASVQADPNLEAPRLNLANVLAALDRPDLAEAHYRAALKLRPFYGEANAGLAGALTQMGRLEEAAGFLEKNLAAGFDEANTHFSLGDIHLQAGSHARAASHFRKAIAAKPDFAAAYNSLGAALLMRGQARGAVRNFSRALELDPGYSKAKKNLEYAQSLLKGADPER